MGIPRRAPAHFDRRTRTAFSISVLPGPFILKLDLNQDGRWQRLGWYAGEEGTTASRDEAQVVTVGDEDLAGVTVRLPVVAASSSWRRISGVVLDHRGQPAMDVRLVADPQEGQLGAREDLEEAERLRSPPRRFLR